MKKYQGIALSLFFSMLVLAALVGFSKLSDNSAANLRNQIGNIDDIVNSGLGSLSAEEKVFDFGIVSMAAGDVSHNFKIKNTGSQPLTVTRIYTSCMCTTASLLKIKGKVGPFGMLGHSFIPALSEGLNANEEAQVEVVFDPAAHGLAGLGKVERMVTLENNGRSGKLELVIRANVAP